MRKNGNIGWILLAAGVVAWDIFCEDALTTAARRALKDPYRRIPTAYIFATTFLHLFGICPKPLDPWHYLGKAQALRERRLRP